VQGGQLEQRPFVPAAQLRAADRDPALAGQVLQEVATPAVHGRGQQAHGLLLVLGGVGGVGRGERGLPLGDVVAVRQGPVERVATAAVHDPLRVVERAP
jgi:hypothetical protein